MNAPPQSKKSQGRGLALVGYRGTGKSTVGRMLAEATGRPFFDADDEIVARAGRTIRAVFEESGESVFRDWEERVIHEITESHPNAILATGGGAILREANRRRLQAFGFVAWLRAEPDELARRLEADAQTRETRPSLTTAGTLNEIIEVLEARTPLYQEAAHAAVDTKGIPPRDVVDLILDHWSRATSSRSFQEPNSCS